jgi:hypothetical protein
MLEAFAPVIASASTLAPTSPLRMAFLFVPNGISMNEWTPGKVGTGFELGSVLEPLADLRGDFSILTGLTQYHAFANGDGPGDHARSSAAWLTGVQPKKTSGADIRNGISADQLAANIIGSQTKFPSLEIGCERGGTAGDCDSGYSCAYSNSISWRSETTPVAKEVNPRALFDRLFGDPSGPNSSERQELRKSILDFVLDDAVSLRGKLGTQDQRKLDEYLTGIRDIEKRLAKLESDSKIAKIEGNRPGVPSSFGDHIRIMGDMMILAFQADLTRVCTFMFANEGSNRSYSNIGVNEGHHEVSHHGKDVRKLEAKRLIDRYHTEQLAYILKRLRDTKENGRSMLDNMMLVYGGGISDGDRHNHDDLPILFAGRAGGAFKQGRHVVYKNGTPLTNLYLSMLDRMGARAEKLGDSTGRLTGLF